MTDYDLRAVHKTSRNNKELVGKSKFVGCFYCLAVSKATDVVKYRTYRKKGEFDAQCPVCTIDSLIPDASGYPIDEAFLIKMRLSWFNK